VREADQAIREKWEIAGRKALVWTAEEAESSQPFSLTNDELFNSFSSTKLPVYISSRN
jgi:hypothetical protein